MPRRMTSALVSAASALVVALSLSAPVALAQNGQPPDYTASAIHILPDGTKTLGKVVKSGTDIRLEYNEAGRQVVQIIRRAEGIMYLIYPATRAYVEVRGTPSADPTGVGYQPPCQENDPLISCTLKGTEVSSGITAELWELSVPGQPGSTSILWDGARHRALRQTFADGTVMNMAFRQMEEIGGRQVEHWQVTYESPGQPPQTGEWFYDPRLRVEVREELPTGEVRSLEDIKVGTVDPSNFTVPSGYYRQDVPPAPVPGSGN